MIGNPFKMNVNTSDRTLEDKARMEAVVFFIEGNVTFSDLYIFWITEVSVGKLVGCVLLGNIKPG